jgi:hypothetical protein
MFFLVIAVCFVLGASGSGCGLFKYGDLTWDLSSFKKYDF